MGDSGLPGHEGHGKPEEERVSSGRDSSARHASETGGYARNFWSDAVPHLCKDGKYRRFESRVFPLADVVSRSVGYSGDPREPEYTNATGEARVMRLRGYGNAICVDTAKLFINACEDVLGGCSEGSDR